MIRRSESGAAGVPVIVVHGLWNRGPESWLLRRRLAARLGRPVIKFRYPSVFRGLPENAARLAALVEAHAPVDLVGYSFGGMVALDALRRLPPGSARRLVLVSSPVRGSAAARSLLRRRRAGRWIVGRSADQLAHGLDAGSPHGADVGVIAGTGGIGMGRALGAMSGSHDGTVHVDETVLDGSERRLILPETHTGMLFSRRVADAIAGFLESGRFPDEGLSPPRGPA